MVAWQGDEDDRGVPLPLRSPREAKLIERTLNRSSTFKAFARLNFWLHFRPQRFPCCQVCFPA